MLIFLLQTFLGHQCLQILIKDFVLLVSKVLETGKCRVELLLGLELDAELRKTLAKGIAPGVLAKHHAICRPAHVLGTHNLVGFATLYYAVLMNPGLMSESIGADDGLVGLHRETGNV